MAVGIYVNFYSDGDHEFSAHIPVDFGWGGIVYLDGEVIKEDGTDIWEGGNSSKLDFTVAVGPGAHLLEILGGEGCCDGTTSWTLKNPDTGAMEQFNVANLDNFCNLG